MQTKLINFPKQTSTFLNASNSFSHLEVSIVGRNPMDNQGLILPEYISSVGLKRKIY